MVGSDFLAVWGGSGGKGRQGASEGVKRCKPLSPLRYSVVWRSSVRAVEFKGVGGGCIRLAKKVPPGQTLFSNILFFQPESRISKFFSGPVFRFQIFFLEAVTDFSEFIGK